MGINFVEDEPFTRSADGSITPGISGDSLDMIIGDNTPSRGTFSPLRILNDIWMQALNYAGSAYINIFKLNEDDEIQVGATLITGSTEAEEDSGAITIMDMPVSATPAAGTQMSYTFKIDGDNILTIYAEADSSGGIQKPGLIAECQINLKEITTPTAKTNYGALYTKTDNKLYFQDGAGVEHLVTMS